MLRVLIFWGQNWHPLMYGNYPRTPEPEALGSRPKVSLVDPPSILYSGLCTQYYGHQNSSYRVLEEFWINKTCCPPQGLPATHHLRTSATITGPGRLRDAAARAGGGGRCGRNGWLNAPQPAQRRSRERNHHQHPRTSLRCLGLSWFIHIYWYVHNISLPKIVASSYNKSSSMLRLRYSLGWGTHCTSQNKSAGVPHSLQPNTCPRTSTRFKLLCWPNPQHLMACKSQPIHAPM